MSNFLKNLFLCLVCFSNIAKAASDYTCTLSTTAINFGNYNPLSAANNDTTGNIAVTCQIISGNNAVVSYVIILSTGNSLSYAQRYMNFGNNQLNYNIYTNTNRTSIWGNGTQSSTTISNSYVLSRQEYPQKTDNFTTYARAPGSQNLPSGVYNDTITVTVNF